MRLSTRSAPLVCCRVYDRLRDLSSFQPQLTTFARSAPAGSTVLAFDVGSFASLHRTRRSVKSYVTYSRSPDAACPQHFLPLPSFPSGHFLALGSCLGQTRCRASATRLLTLRFRNLVAALTLLLRFASRRASALSLASECAFRSVLAQLVSVDDLASLQLFEHSDVDLGLTIATLPHSPRKLQPLHFGLRLIGKRRSRDVLPSLSTSTLRADPCGRRRASSRQRTHGLWLCAASSLPRFVPLRLLTHSAGPLVSCEPASGQPRCNEFAHAWKGFARCPHGPFPRASCSRCSRLDVQRSFTRVAAC